MLQENNKIGIRKEKGPIKREKVVWQVDKMGILSVADWGERQIKRHIRG